MKDISHYAHINARIRVKLGRLLKPEQWRQLNACSGLPALVGRLEGTRYAKLTQNRSPEEFVRTLDTVIHQENVTEEKRIISFLSGTPADIIKTLTEEFDIEFIKQGLRAWKRKTKFTVPDNTAVSGRYPIDWEIFTKQSSSIEEIILSLMHTPYGPALNKSLDLYKKTGNLFYLEAVLEKDLFTRVWQQIGMLGGHDKKAVSRLLGLRIDVLNIRNLIRCKLYFELPPDHIQHVIYPKGAHLREDQCFAAYVQKDNREFMKNIALPPFHTLIDKLKAEDIKHSALLLNELLQAALYREIRKVLQGYPFTLAVILAYIFLNRWEMHQLRSLAWSLYMGTKEEMKSTFDASPLAQQ